MESSFVTLSRSTAGAAGAATAAGTAMIVLAEQIGQIAIQARDAQVELEILATRTGESTSAVLGMKAALVGTGVTFGQYADIIKDTDDKLGDFVLTGGGEAKEAMEFLTEATGKSAEELAKLGGKDFLGLLQTEMDKAGLSTQKQTNLLESLGNEASRLSPFLRMTAEEQEELTRRFGETATVLSDETIEAINTYDRQSQLLSGNIDTFITNALLPLIEAWGNVKEAIAGALNESSEHLDRQRRSAEAQVKFADDIAAAEKKVADARKAVNEYSYGTKNPADEAKKQQELNDALAEQANVLGRVADYVNQTGEFAPVELLIEPKIDPKKKEEVKKEVKETTEPYGGSLLPDSEQVPSGAPEVARGIYNTTTVDSGAMAMIEQQNAEKLALQAQYQQEAIDMSLDQAYRDALLGGNPSDILDAQKALLEQQRLQELAQLDQRLADTQAYKDKEAAINAQYRQTNEQLDKAAADASLNNMLGSVDQIGAALGVQFNLMKNYAIAETLVNQSQAIADAWTDPDNVTTGQKIAASAEAGLAIGAALAQLYTINFSQAHGGLDSVPDGMDNSTFLLRAGERVVQPRQNAELTEFLKLKRPMTISHPAAPQLTKPTPSPMAVMTSTV